MSFFDKLLGNNQGSGSPAPPKGPGAVRETLFGDLPAAEWPPAGDPGAAFPWSAFVKARNESAAGRRDAATAIWREIADAPDLEPRHTLQAWHFLRSHGVQPPDEIAKRLLGVVIEVGMPGGTDLLAAYPDHSARYYNYSGSGVVWDRPDGSLDPAIDKLLDASSRLVVKIGAWNEARPPVPPVDQGRMSFLTPSGQHFGQGPMRALSADPLAAAVIGSAVELMTALIDKSQAAR